MRKKKTATTNPVTLRLDDELNRQFQEAITITKLGRSDLARLAIQRGLKILVTQLTTPVEPAAA